MGPPGPTLGELVAPYLVLTNLVLTIFCLPVGAFVIQLGRALLDEGRREDALPAMRVASPSAGSLCPWRLVPTAKRLRRIGGGALILIGGLMGVGPLAVVINQLVATPLLLALGFPKNHWLLWLDVR